MGGRTPPVRKRGIAREPRGSMSVSGGSESSALLGSHERNVRGDRPSAFVVVVVNLVVDVDHDGGGLDRSSVFFFLFPCS